MLYCIDNFLTPDECYALIEIINTCTEKSGVVNREGHTIDNSRVSDTHTFNEEEEFIYTIKKRIAEEIGLRITQGEKLQGVRYQAGGYFREHHDWFDKETLEIDGSKMGNRIKTVMIYLNDNFEGGETNFPLLKKRLSPKEGSAWIWDNIKNGEGIKESLHGGTPVVAGHKYIITSWWREHDYTNKK